MAQVPGRKLPLETFHQVVLTDDQLNTVSWALATLKDYLNGIERYEELDNRDLGQEVENIDQVITQLDGLR